MNGSFMPVKLIRMTQYSIKLHGLHRGDPHLQRANLSIIKFSRALNVSRKKAHIETSHKFQPLYAISIGRVCVLAATAVRSCLHTV